jgi:hypothetical protein
VTPIAVGFLPCSQGGVKVLAKIMRTFMGVDAEVLALTSRVLHKCCLGSPLMQQSLIKEKVGLGPIWFLGR